MKFKMFTNKINNMEKLFRIRCSQIGKIMSNAKVKGELSAGTKTYLHEWYANDNEQIHSKYIDKGNAVEDDLITFMAEQLGFGMADKNMVHASNEFMTGTCDVDLANLDIIVDVKASYNRKTLQQQALDGLDKDYEMQLQGYLHLYGRKKAILFFGLMDTPSTNWSEEIVYEDMPANERWIGYNIDYNPEFIKAVEERVLMCRMYLETHDKLIKSKLGKIN